MTVENFKVKSIKHTKKWAEIDSQDELNLKLYSFFDEVNWVTKYAIAKNDDVIFICERETYSNIYDFFFGVCEVIRRGNLK